MPGARCAGRGVKLRINGCEVIDDTYNANPDSVLAAIDLLALRRHRACWCWATWEKLAYADLISIVRSGSTPASAESMRFSQSVR